jgi:hypothetical protein
MTLEDAIREFKKIHKHLSHPERANGTCGAYSYRFIRFLADNQVAEALKAKEVVYTASTARHHPLRPPILRFSEDRKLDSEEDRGIGQWTDHCVVGIGKLRIDWTARQFDEKAPHPLIWSTRS